MYRKNLQAAFLLLATAGAGSFASAADSDHYRWKDSNGETVFSDQPPPNSENYEVIQAPNNLNPDLEPDLKPETPDQVNDAPQTSGSGESTEDDAQDNAGSCERAKKNLALLESPDKVSVRNEKGEVQELSPQERTVMQQTARAKIDVYCE